MAVTFLTNEDKVVRYDGQTLSEAEKKKARENIGAAGDTAEADASYLFEDKWSYKSPFFGSTKSPATYYGIVENSFTRASMAEPVYLEEPLTVSCSSDWNWTYVLWDTPTSGFGGDKGWISEARTIPAGKYVTFSARKVSNGNLTLAEVKENLFFTQTALLEDALGKANAKTAENERRIAALETAIPVNPFVRAIAHRGYSSEAPENTLAAYRLAKQKGFTAVEADVYVSSDGVPVLLHDYTVDRTTNGAYTGGVDTFTLAELKAMDFSYTFSEDYPNERIPTLEEFLLLCRNLGLHAYLDLRYGNAEVLVGIVKKYGMLRNVTWLHTNVSVLESIKALDGKARLAVLTEAVTEENVTNAVSLKTDGNDVIIDCANYGLTDEGVQLCVDANLPLEVWTVNTETAVQNLNPYITGITTDAVLPWKTLYNASMI